MAGETSIYFTLSYAIVDSSYILNRTDELVITNSVDYRYKAN